MAHGRPTSGLLLKGKGAPLARWRWNDFFLIPGKNGIHCCVFILLSLILFRNTIMREDRVGARGVLRRLLLLCTFPSYRDSRCHAVTATIAKTMPAPGLNSHLSTNFTTSHSPESSNSHIASFAQALDSMPPRPREPSSDFNNVG